MSGLELPNLPIVTMVALAGQPADVVVVNAEGAVSHRMVIAKLDLLDPETGRFGDLAVLIPVEVAVQMADNLSRLLAEENISLDSIVNLKVALDGEETVNFLKGPPDADQP